MVAPNAFQSGIPDLQEPPLESMVGHHALDDVGVPSDVFAQVPVLRVFELGAMKHVNFTLARDSWH